MKILVCNTKGGSSKSTTSMQCAAAYFLSRGEEVTLHELDDENRDAECFNRTKILTNQIKVEDGSDLSLELTKILSKRETNAIVDVGGNRTTTITLEALARSRMSIAVDLFIIPMSGGSQDFLNAVKTYEMIKDFNRPIVFALSRARRPLKDPRVRYQFSNFFEKFSKSKFFFLRDSDAVDLSRDTGKTVYELAMDQSFKAGLEAQIATCFQAGDDNGIYAAQTMLDIYDDAGEWHTECLKPAFKLLDTFNPKNGDKNGNA